jgi:hypothetical protein
MTKDPQLSRRPSSDERFGNLPCQLIAIQIERLQAFESAESFGKCSLKIVVGQIQPNDRRLAIVALSALYAVPAALCSWRSKPPDAMCPLRPPADSNSATSAARSAAETGPSANRPLKPGGSPAASC